MPCLTFCFWIDVIYTQYVINLSCASRLAPVAFVHSIGFIKKENGRQLTHSEPVQSYDEDHLNIQQRSRRKECIEQKQTRQARSIVSALSLRLPWRQRVPELQKEIIESSRAT